MKSETMRLVEQTCANYGDGHCLILDRPCVYQNDTTNLRRCGYFEEAVLPGNPILEAKYHAARGQVDNRPRCESCGDPFERKSNRQKYCSECAVEIRKQKQRNYNRELRTKRAL